MARIIPALGLAVLTALGGLTTATGAETVFEKQNMAITMPEGWQDVTSRMHQPSVVTVYASPTGSSVVMVIVDDQHGAPVLDEKFTSQFDKGIEAGGGWTKKTGKFTDRDGMKWYERTSEVEKDGKVMTNVVEVTTGNDKIYSIQGLKFDGPASEDPTIRKAMESFRFLKPPTPAPTPFVVDKDSTAYKIGAMLGKSVPFFLFLAATGIVMWVLKRVRAKKTQGR